MQMITKSGPHIERRSQFIRLALQLMPEKENDGCSIDA